MSNNRKAKICFELERGGSLGPLNSNSIPMLFRLWTKSGIENNSSIKESNIELTIVSKSE